MNVVKWSHVCLPINDKNTFTVYGWIRNQIKQIDDLMIFPDVLFKLILIFYLINDKFRTNLKGDAELNTIKYSSWNEFISLKQDSKFKFTFTAQSMQDFGCFFGSFKTSISPLKLFPPKLTKLRYSNTTDENIIYIDQQHQIQNQDTDEKKIIITTRRRRRRPQYNNVHCDINACDNTLQSYTFYYGDYVIQWAITFFRDLNLPTKAYLTDNFMRKGYATNYIGIQSGHNDVFAQFQGIPNYHKKKATNAIPIAAYFSAETGILYTFNLHRNYKPKNESYEKDNDKINHTWKQHFICSPQYPDYLKNHYTLYMRAFTGSFQVQFGYSPGEYTSQIIWRNPIPFWFPFNRRTFWLSVLAGNASSVKITSFCIKTNN